MARRNPWSLSVGTFQVGGESQTYLLHGPYSLRRTAREFRIVAEVIVVATDYDTLQSLSDALELAFSTRDVSLTIDIDGNTWTYLHGSNLLNSSATCEKTGNRQTDKGLSRSYLVSVEGAVPAPTDGGLRDLEVAVSFTPSRQQVVEMHGVYEQGSASSAYLSDFDSEASSILSALPGSVTYELVEENYTRDRNDHRCEFRRQYVQLLMDQQSGTVDADEIRDHRVNFTELISGPGDYREDIYRMRRVVGTYDAAVDVDEVDLSQDKALQDVVNDIVRRVVVEFFRESFEPKVFAVADWRVTYDETAARVSCSFEFVYQPDGGEDVIELTQTVALNESRRLDRTPVHNQDEYAAEIDQGFAERLRVTTRTVRVIGTDEPRKRIGEASTKGPAGEIDGLESGPYVRQSDGWNMIENRSRATRSWIGIPGIDGVELIETTTLDEIVVESFHRRPSSSRRTG